MSQSLTDPPSGTLTGPSAAHSISHRVRGILHRHPAVSPAVVLASAVVLFGLLNERFIHPANLSLITQQVAIVGTLAAAQTLIILTAGIDLSIGAAMVTSAMVMAQLSTSAGLPAGMAIAIGLFVGLLTGAINGTLVTRLGLPPFIVTLGTLSIFSATALLYSGGQTVRGSDLPGLLTAAGSTFSVFGVHITLGVLVMLGIYAILAYGLHQTAWGRHIYAVGDDAESSRLAGIRTNRVKLSAYLTAGVIVAITAWIYIGRTNAANPNTGVDLNLDSITAVVIGGTSLFGGRGAIWGTLLGALIVGVFRNGLSLIGVDVLYQTLTVGVLVIVAVSIDQWIRKAYS